MSIKNVSAICIGLILAYLLINKLLINKNMNNLKLKMFLDINLQKSILDPAKLDTLPKAILSDNLNARLIINDNGKYKPWLATSFSVDGKLLHFKLGDSKTSKGQFITAFDVKASLERLIFLDTNTHAKLQIFVDCEDFKKNGKCENIIIEDEKNLKIVLKKEKYVGQLIKILSATEYGIIPENAVENNIIIDYTNTTGAFYLSGNTLEKNIFFKSDFNYPDKIDLVTALGEKKPIDLLLSGDVDILTTGSKISESAFRLIEKNDSINIFETENIQLFNIAFGPGGFRNVNSIERSTLINKLRDNIFENYPKPLGAKKAYNFLPETFFSVNTPEVKNLNYSIAEKKIKFIAYNGMQENLKSLENIKEIEVKFTDDFPPEVSFEKRPDSYIMASDVGFEADYTLFSYYLNSDLIHIPTSEKNKFLNSLIEAEDDQVRLTLVNDFHQKIIENALIGPLFSSPYTILTRVPFISKQSKLTASTKLWLLEKK
jgi:hypothetical protein